MILNKWMWRMGVELGKNGGKKALPLFKGPFCLPHKEKKTNEWQKNRMCTWTKLVDWERHYSMTWQSCCIKELLRSVPLIKFLLGWSHFSVNNFPIPCLQGKLPEFWELKGESLLAISICIWHLLKPFVCSKIEFLSPDPVISYPCDILS